MPSNFWKRAVVLSLATALYTLTLHAQVTTADVVGTVTDSTGAVIPGARVSIVNLATQVTSTAITNGGGDYTFSLLIPGPYSLRIEAQNFKALMVTRFTLAA